MTIETKFKPNDVVWYIDKSRYKAQSTDIPCSFCNGTGISEGKACTARTGFFECRNGIIFKMTETYFYYKNIVEVVEMSADRWDIDISYRCDDDKYYDESELYATEEEAQAECDRRNAECNSPQQ